MAEMRVLQEVSRARTLPQIQFEISDKPGDHVTLDNPYETIQIYSASTQVPNTSLKPLGKITNMGYLALPDFRRFGEEHNIVEAYVGDYEEQQRGFGIRGFGLYWHTPGATLHQVHGTEHEDPFTEAFTLFLNRPPEHFSASVLSELPVERRMNGGLHSLIARMPYEVVRRRGNGDIREHKEHLLVYKFR